MIETNRASENMKKAAEQYLTLLNKKDELVREYTKRSDKVDSVLLDVILHRVLVEEYGLLED